MMKFMNMDMCGRVVSVVEKEKNNLRPWKRAEVMYCGVITLDYEHLITCPTRKIEFAFRPLRYWSFSTVVPYLQAML